MTEKRRSSTGVAIITAILLAFVLLVVGSTEPSVQAAPGADPLNNPHNQSLLAKAQQQGNIKVIVRLNTEFRPEGSLGFFSSTKQRRQIQQLQADVLARLPAEAVRSSKGFDHLPFLVMEISEDGLRDLLALPEVLSIEEDIPVPPALAESVPLIGADDAWTAGYDGSGWAVAILDTGVDTSHSAFDGKVVAEACFSGGGTTGGEGATLCPDGSVEQIGTGAGLNCSTGIYGCDHGTHVAGIAVGAGSPAGVAKGGSLIPIQIFSEFSGSSCTNFGLPDPCALTYSSDQISALNWLYDVVGTYQIASANMSIGGSTPQYSHCDGDPRKLAIDNLISVNIATVIAAGNSGYSDALSSPACISSSISVGASTDSDAAAAYSNVAEFMDLFAPGSSIYSAVPGGGYGTMQGTSMAAPHVAGSWAILKSKDPFAGVDELLALLVDNGIPVTDDDGPVTKPRIQVDAALSALTAPTPTPSPTATPEPTPVELAPYFDAIEMTSGLSQPLYVTNAGDGSNRLFVVERAGLIKIVQDGSVLADPFLDVSSQVTTGGSEQGLLGLAFHPNYASNGEFFVHYTAIDGAITVSRLTVAADPDVADAGSEQVLLSINKSNTNHNGGMLAFGPDGYLYVATGDGGGGGDPDENGQDLSTLLGKVLRIDVDSGSPYTVPSSNPFAGDGDASTLGEIWAYGLRNPWRFSFDRTSGDLFIADVGQSAREEINYQAASSTGGENYGWDVMEGSLCYEPSSGCNTSGKVTPVVEYSHSLSGVCSVTGGYVYRGADYPEMDGIYIYGDFCSGDIWSLDYDEAFGWANRSLADTSYRISSFGEDESGELYFLDYAGGTLYKVHIQQFADVSYDQWAVDYIEELYQAGFVAGCSVDPRNYCPDRILNRSESAVFVLRGEYGAISDPPHSPPGSPTFQDVAKSFWGYGWIESLWADGFTAGCNTDPLQYCPDRQHSRAEGSVFFLRIKNGIDFEPPAPSGIFDDVDVNAWYAGWVEAAYNEGILPECGSDPLQFCPEDLLDRSWAAYMMVQAKGGLPLE